MSPLFFNMYKGGVTKEVKMGMGRIGMKFLEEGREWILPGLLHAENWIFCGVAEEDLKVMMRRFVEVCRRRGVKVNKNKNKVMVIGGEEGLECDIPGDGYNWSKCQSLNILDVL